MKNNHPFLMIMLAGLMFAFNSCSKADDGDNNGNCLSPATSYFTMDGVAADSGTTTVVFESNNGYCQFRYAEFSGLINSSLLELSDVRLSLRFMKGTQFVTTNIKLQDSIAEGGCMKFPLRLMTNIRADSVCAFLQFDTREKRPTSTGTSTDNYQGYVMGNVFVSKVGGKLRFTSDGILNAPISGVQTVNHTINFSGLSGETY